MGALASGGIQVLDGDLIRKLQVQPYAVDMAIKKEMRELARREERYDAGSAPPVLRGRTAILVDEGSLPVSPCAPRSGLHANSNRHGSSSPSRSARARRSACWKRRLTKWCVFARRNHLLPWVCGTQQFGQTTDEEVRELLGRTRDRDRLAG